MSKSLLKQARVLELNRFCLAIGWRTVEDVMCLFCKGAVKAWDVYVSESGAPELSVQMTWEQWLQKPIGPNELVVRAAHCSVAVPEIVVDTTYESMPKAGLSFGLEGIFIRDKGICQYTGQRLVLDPNAPDEIAATMDHVIPQDPLKGNGSTSWENIVLASRKINAFKANRTPEEAGLKLRGRAPARPAPVLRMLTLKNQSKSAVCEPFLPAYFNEAFVAMT